MKKAIIITLCAGCLLLVGIKLYQYQTLDRSAVINTEGGFIWKGVQYVPIVAEAEELGKCIAKTTDGHKISEYKDDPSHTFLELRSFLDNNMVVREDYVIPTEGEFSCAYVSGNRFTDSSFLDVLSEIAEYEFSDKFYIETDNILYYAKKIYVGYNDCPIGTQKFGFIGNINDKWCFLYPDIETNNSRERRVETYECNIIPEKYANVLSDLDWFPARIEDEVAKP